MSTRFTDFISSFGVMMIGLAVLGFGSVTLTQAKVESVVARFPLSKAQIIDETQLVRMAMFPVSQPAVPRIAEQEVFTGSQTAESIVVVDDKTNTVLYKKNATAIRSLASITKLMTALVLLETPMRWASSTVIVEADLADDTYLKVGERYQLRDLWDVGLVGSSNSAMRAMVRESGLSEENFVARMNDKARALGLLTMRFVEPTGLDNLNMGSTLDVARLLQVTLEQEMIKKTLSIQEYFAQPLNSKEKRRIWSTNWLLTRWIPHQFSEQVIGKTGFIADSGYNLAVAVTDAQKHRLRVVVLGASSNEFRFSEARDIAEWVFVHVRWPEDNFAAIIQ
ncbi:MAG: hypothetical protein A3I29_03700 [Candidatus Magasanikbacteria bacterium RIFCSPLOWO2_02_FULL_44_11]|uniref:Peptidase S11 D-alanyl-D-alanine carboxypeptidase A N-terminal domain-containing protein n=2 Tax=Candidatus Magasanikiibacteriota TaxID=1752731 RepID=A0A1F6NAR4_9BACT|nr:MAG: hypothetical protein A3D53_00020 [Candidatus Magasanikbacteria bacterium RIFCSPHIGHO2_02_FULL_45_10]OGH80969.1 MAG: hypothetical protein A3I29_03700 [Candidatus Magasanikbacteria bacterium RIFCSPLOWO2_02_FULL_44_11]